MKKKDTIYCSVLCGLTLLIGLFFGATFQQNKEACLMNEAEGLNSVISDEIKMKEYWENRWHRQDTVLHKISAHKDCTFEIKTIIGELN